MNRANCEHRNKFCFVCGLFTPRAHGRNIKDSVETAYERYFKMVVVDHWYKPQIVCTYCRTGLAKSPPKCKYVLPMQWLPRSEHSAHSCYFCINIDKAFGFTYGTRDKIPYEMVQTVIEPTRRSKENPVAQSEEVDDHDEMDDVEMDMDLEEGAIGEQPDDAIAGPSSSTGPHVPPSAETTPPGAHGIPPIDSPSPPSAIDTSSTFTPDRHDIQKSNEPVLFTQKDVDNLSKDLQLNDKQREVLGSRLKDHNAVAPDFLITSGNSNAQLRLMDTQKKMHESQIKHHNIVAPVDLFISGRKRFRTQEYDELFRTDEVTHMTYCWNIRLLFLRMKQVHNPGEWRLFIDGGKKSLKAVLLHITNKYPSIPIAHGSNVSETYENIGAILKLIQYEEYNWFICADLKIVAILMGLTQGYAKHQCFLCLWEGRKSELHYDYNHKWPPRNTIRIGQANQEKEPLVKDRTKILLPPLHIKLGLVRNFTMKLDRDGDAYECLVQIMKKLGVSEAKVANGKCKYSTFFYLFYSVF